VWAYIVVGKPPALWVGGMPLGGPPARWTGGMPPQPRWMGGRFSALGRSLGKILGPPARWMGSPASRFPHDQRAGGTHFSKIFKTAPFFKFIFYPFFKHPPPRGVLPMPCAKVSRVPVRPALWQCRCVAGCPTPGRNTGRPRTSAARVSGSQSYTSPCPIKL
jgi:hypothetical protein